jgi:hypothetical protein
MQPQTPKCTVAGLLIRSSGYSELLFAIESDTNDINMFLDRKVSGDDLPRERLAPAAQRLRGIRFS